MTGGSIPVGHHYIGQFIPRNFRCDKGRRLRYVAEDGAEVYNRKFIEEGKTWK